MPYLWVPANVQGTSSRQKEKDYDEGKLLLQSRPVRGGEPTLVRWNLSLFKVP
jgi:hypothetical protein